MRQEVAQQSMKSAPAVAVTFWGWVQGLTLPDVVALATLGYIGLQALYLMWRWFHERRALKKKGK